MAMNKFFRIPFATSGDKVPVPDASQPSGSVSYTDGFGPDYGLDPLVDPAAKDVPRDATNQLYYDITNAIKEYQEFGVPDFITSVLNGGVPFTYARYARVKWTDGKVYESTTNGNTSDPSNTTNWRVLTDNADYLTIATTAFQASVSDGEAVYWDGTQFDEAIADGTNKQNVVGFADVTNGRVFVAGLYAGQLTGLTANTPYYLSTTTPGALVTTSSAVRMGIARTATSFFVSIENSSQSIPPGTRISFTGATAPAGFLACPTSPTNISRTTYAALFAAIGTTWGVGDGATTFGMPYYPANYTGVQANANVGSATVGENLAHTHSGVVTNIPNTGANYLGAGSPFSPILGSTASSGGSANLAAGIRELFCVKF